MYQPFNSFIQQCRLNSYGFLIGCLALAFIFQSCSRGSCPLQSGATTTQTRDLPAFNEIILNDKVNLILTEDTTQLVQVSGGKNLLPNIQTSVNAQVLTIGDNNKCNLLRDPTAQVSVYVSSNQLQKITYYGAGNVSTSNTLHVPSFIVDSWTGSGTINLSLQAGQVQTLVRNENATVILNGSADTAYIYCGEAGAVNMLDCPAGIVTISHKSIRDIYVTVTGSLQADILYNGNVFYAGSPSNIDSLITGAGRLIHIP